LQDRPFLTKTGARRPLHYGLLSLVPHYPSTTVVDTDQTEHTFRLPTCLKATLSEFPGAYRLAIIHAQGICERFVLCDFQLDEACTLLVAKLERANCLSSRKATALFQSRPNAKRPMETSLIRLMLHGGMIVIEHEMEHATKTDKRCYEKQANSPRVMATARERCLLVPSHEHKALFTFVYS